MEGRCRPIRGARSAWCLLRPSSRRPIPIGISPVLSYGWTWESMSHICRGAWEWQNSRRCCSQRVGLVYHGKSPMSLGNISSTDLLGDKSCATIHLSTWSVTVSGRNQRQFEGWNQVPLEKETASVLPLLSFNRLALQKEFTQGPSLDTASAELLTTRISSAWAEEPTSRPRHDDLSNNNDEGTGIMRMRINVTTFRTSR